jgi:hypothetical protein
MSFGILAALVAAIPPAYAQGTMAIGKKGDVEFTATTHVGSTTLKPGHYRFQHQIIDGQHYLVVRAQTTVPGTPGSPSSHYAGATKDEVARVPCRVVSSDKKRPVTALYTRKEADGTLTVTQIDIQGEKGGHVVLEPQA